MVNPPEEGGLKEARYACNNIIISDSAIRNILPPQLKNISAWYKVICGCEHLISVKSMHCALLTCSDSHMKQLKHQSHNAQNRRSGKKESFIFETYNNSVRSHGFHIHNTAANMDMETMCTCTSAHHALPQ